MRCRRGSPRRTNRLARCSVVEAVIGTNRVGRDRSVARTTHQYVPTAAEDSLELENLRVAVS